MSVFNSLQIFEVQFPNFGKKQGCKTFGFSVTEHGVTEQWSYTDFNPDFCTLSSLAAHYFSLLQQAWRLLWVDQGSSPRLRKTAHN
jgi:hypothetical protein